MSYNFRNNKPWGQNFSKSSHALTQAISSDDFPEFITEVMEAGIRSAFLDTLVGRELCTFEKMSSPLISWLREDGFDAGFIGEMEEPPTATVRHSKYTVRPVKIGMSLQWSMETVEDVELDIIGGRMLPKVGRAIAHAEDRYVMYNLLNMVADGSSDYRSGDYVTNHILDASDSSWTVSGTLDHEKLAVGMFVMEKEGWDVSHVIMSPAQRANLNLLAPFYGTSGWQNFTPRATKGVEDASFKADIGIPSSAQLVITNTIDDDKVLFLSKENYAKFWERRPLTLTQQPKTPNELFKSSFAERVASAVVEPSAATLIQNLDYIDPSAFTG